MKTFANTLIILLSAVIVLGCNDKNVSPDVTLKQLVIKNDYVLQGNSHNVQYNLNSPAISFDLNGYTLSSDGDDNLVVVRSSNVNIKNGTISSGGFSTGIHIASCINVDDVDKLNTSPAEHEPVIYDRCSKNVTVENITFKNLKTGVYVGDYTQLHSIFKNKFYDIDRMGIYLSPAVTNAVIHNNRFVNNGHRKVEDYGRPRGSISFDSAYGNTVTNNYFNTSPKFVNRLFDIYYRVPELEFYRNCGEPTFGDKVLPRIHGADNNLIENNTFENVGLVAWFRYRHHDQLGSCIGNYPDKSDNNKLTGSTLINIKEFVIDEGNGNIW